MRSIFLLFQDWFWAVECCWIKHACTGYLPFKYICQFSKYLLNAYYMPDTALVFGDKKVNKTKAKSCWLSPSSEWNHKKKRQRKGKQIQKTISVSNKHIKNSNRGTWVEIRIERQLDWQWWGLSEETKSGLTTEWCKEQTQCGCKSQPRNGSCFTCSSKLQPSRPYNGHQGPKVKKALVTPSSWSSFALLAHSVPATKATGWPRAGTLPGWRLSTGSEVALPSTQSTPPQTSAWLTPSTRPT